MKRIPIVYMMSNRRRGTIYIGVTSNIVKRVFEHKSKFVEGFTEKYNLDQLVYYEVCPGIVAAINREKQLKAGSRDKKIELVESFNPMWKDLYSEICRY